MTGPPPHDAMRRGIFASILNEIIQITRFVVLDLVELQTGIGGEQLGCETLFPCIHQRIGRILQSALKQAAILEEDEIGDHARKTASLPEMDLVVGVILGEFFLWFACQKAG